MDIKTPTRQASRVVGSVEYITYSGALTIILSFWLSWFIDMVSEARVTRSHDRVQISTTPHLNWNI